MPGGVIAKDASKRQPTPIFKFVQIAEDNCMFSQDMQHRIAELNRSAIIWFDGCEQYWPGLVAQGDRKQMYVFSTRATQNCRVEQVCNSVAWRMRTALAWILRAGWANVASLVGGPARTEPKVVNTQLRHVL